MRVLTSFSPYAAIGCASLFGVVGPWVARRVPPMAATWLLTLGSVLSATAAALVLGVVALPLVGQDDALSDEMHWSTSVLAHHSPVGRGVAVVALVLLALLVIRTLVAARYRAQNLAAAGRTCRALRPPVGDLVVAASAEPDAYAVPGFPGVIVLTTALLNELSSEHRCAVLAHERSHLNHRHAWHSSAGLLAARLNPLLAAVPRALDYAIERWADEDAAALTDRRTAAGALLRVAESVSERVRRSPVVLAAAESAVGIRIAALLDGPPRRRPELLLGAAVLVALAVVSALVVTHRTIDVFQLAIAVGRHTVWRDD